MRNLIVYKRPRTNYPMSESRRHGSYDQYDTPYYDEDDYYDRPSKMKRSNEEYPYYDYDEDYEEPDYQDRGYRGRGYEDREYPRKGGERYRSEHGRNASFVLPNEQVANMIMNASSFGEYIAKHGYHFTAQLADCASKMMKNVNNREHRWTSDQIKQQLMIHGLNDLGKCTLGDITFLANMAYADFYPDVLNSEHACIKYAIAVAKDPDGYDGIVFSRWIADLIGKKVTSIDWEEYV